MMKNLLLLLFSVSLIHVNAQTWKYAALGEAYSSSNSATAVVKDDADNVYVGGAFGQCYHCDGMPNGAFITKISPAGSVLWSDTVMNQPFYCRIIINSIILRPGDVVSVSGTLYRSVNFMGFPLACPNYKVGFFAELDANGNCLRADTLDYIPSKVILNADHSLSIAGEAEYAMTNLNFDPPSGNFVGNFSDYETANWIHNLPTTYSNYDGMEIASNSSNAVYVSNHNGVLVKYRDSVATQVLPWGSKTFEIIGDHIAGSDLGGWSFTISDTSGVLIGEHGINAAAYNRINSIQQSEGKFLIGGTFSDSLLYDGVRYAPAISSGDHEFVLTIDTSGALLNYLIIDQVSGSYPAALGPFFIQAIGNDIFIQGGIETAAAFGSDTLVGDCCGMSSWFYARYSFDAATSVVNNSDASIECSVYPNPFVGSTQLTVRNAGDAEHLLEIYSMQGSLVRSEAFNGSTIIISAGELPSGMYFYRLKQQGTQHASDGKLLIR